MGYGGLSCGYCHRPLRTHEKVARHRLKTARPLYPIVLRTKRSASVVAQEAVHRTRLVVQGIYPDLRYVATLGNKQTAQLHNEVAEVASNAANKFRQPFRIARVVDYCRYWQCDKAPSLHDVRYMPYRPSCLWSRRRRPRSYRQGSCCASYRHLPNISVQGL